MTLQNLFYIFAIVFMTVGIFILIVIGYVLFVIKQNITHLQKVIDEKVDALTRFTNDPTDAAISIGTKVAKTAAKKVKEALSK